MKNEIEPYQLSSRWYRQPITDPIAVITSIFGRDHLSTYRKAIYAFWKAASRPQLQTKVSPGYFLSLVETIESLLNVAYLLKDQNSPFLITEEDLMNPCYFGKGQLGASDFDCFPRMLSRKDCLNPYRVFGKVLAYQSLEEWKDELHELLLDAQSKTLSTEIHWDGVSFCRHLIKLFEAAHLIDVREGSRQHSRLEKTNDTVNI